MHTLAHQELAHRDCVGTIEAQGLDRGATIRCPANQRRAVPREVFRPNMLARMKEPHDLAGFCVHAGEVRSFIAVAEAAGERQVVHFARAAVLPGNDVVNVEGNFGKRLRKVAVLATVFRPLANGSLNRWLHCGAQAGAELSRSERRALALRNSSARPTLR